VHDGDDLLTVDKTRFGQLIRRNWEYTVSTKCKELWKRFRLRAI